jgi:hypothetical protein
VFRATDNAGILRRVLHTTFYDENKDERYPVFGLRGSHGVVWGLIVVQDNTDCGEEFAFVDFRRAR